MGVSALAGTPSPFRGPGRSRPVRPEQTITKLRKEVLVDDPQRGGPDIILSIEGKPVRTEADLRKALLAEKPGSIVSLRIYNARAQNRRVERIRLGSD